jgi:hypothetical protein
MIGKGLLEWEYQITNSAAYSTAAGINDMVMMIIPNYSRPGAPARPNYLSDRALPWGDLWIRHAGG